MLQADEPQKNSPFTATFSYYHENHEDKSLKDIMVDHGFTKNREMNFLEHVLINHAMRENQELMKLSPRPDDWVKSALLSEEGGYGYVLCNLQENSDVNVEINLN